MIIYLTEILIILVLLILSYTQIAVPLMTGKTLFPLFNKDLAAADELIDEAQTKHEINDKLNKAKNIEKDIK